MESWLEIKRRKCCMTGTCLWGREREKEQERDERWSRVWGWGSVRAICSRSQRNTINANKTRHMWKKPNMMCMRERRRNGEWNEAGGPTEGRLTKVESRQSKRVRAREDTRICLLSACINKLPSGPSICSNTPPAPFYSSCCSFSSYASLLPWTKEELPGLKLPIRVNCQLLRMGNREKSLCNVINRKVRKRRRRG